MNTANTKAQLIALIDEHESDYWLALANGWAGSEELAETIERLRERIGEKSE
tara:strand:+ start:1804 stop:1959 length:156 start_codon:yes stop_codon:yes gene_type:complete